MLKIMVVGFFWCSEFSYAFAQAPLTLESAVDYALKNGLRAQIYRLDRQYAEHSAAADRPNTAPTVHITASTTVQGPTVNLPGSPPGAPPVVPTIGTQATLEIGQILVAAGRGAARERYAGELTLARLEALQMRAELVRDIAHAYYQAESAQAFADVAADAAAAAQRRQGTIATMVEVGTASQQEMLLAVADSAAAEQKELDAREAATVAVGYLSRLMGADPSASVVLAPLTEPGPIPDSSDAGETQALESRPDLLLLASQLVVYRAAKQLALDVSRPILSARAVATQQNPTALTRSTYYGVGLVLQWYPFETAQSTAQAAQADDMARKTELQLKDARAGARLQVQQAWRAMGSAASRTIAAQREVAATTSAEQIAQLRYRVRAAAYTEIQNARFRVVQAQANLIHAKVDALTAYSDYVYATGATPKEVGSQ